MNTCTIIIFGASGDLTKRKLLPALYELVAKKKLEDFILIGAAFDKTSMQDIVKNALPFIKNADQKIIDYLLSRSFYYHLDFNNLDDYKRVSAEVERHEKKHKLSGNRLIYFAAAPQFFSTLTQYCAQSALAQKKLPADHVWHRLVYEKPFGYDVQSARSINAIIAEHFFESQIFRIDHYLTKEIVGNIALVRFTNLVFEPLWNNRYVDNVQIILSEKIGVESRGSYYDSYGALKDMMQNHMLEILALIAMEPPAWLRGDYIRSERAKVLEKVQVVDAMFGQYQGYQHEKDVHPQSTTETFVAACVTINNPRWLGVPFYLKTGKCLDKKETIIHIKFKQVDCLLAKHCPSDTNYLTIKVTPDPSFNLTLNVKKPETAHEVTPVNLEFCHSCLFGSEIPEAYEVIFEEIIKGEQSISVRSDEIESAWQITEKLETFKKTLYEYDKGSKGPKQMQHFSFKHGMNWKS